MDGGFKRSASSHILQPRRQRTEKNLRGYLERNFSEKIPPVSEMLINRPDLSTLTQHIFSVVETLSTGEEATAKISLIQRGIKTLIREMKQTDENEKDRTNIFAADTMGASSQHIKEKLTNIALQRQFAELEEKSKMHVEETNLLQEEIEDLYNQKSKDQIRMTQIKRAYEDQISKLNHQISLMTDQERDVQNRLKIAEGDIARLKSQLEHEREDNSGRIKEINDLTQQLTRKSEAILKLKTMVKRLQNELMEAGTKNQRLEMSVQSITLNDISGISKKENRNLVNEIGSLTRAIDDLNCQMEDKELECQQLRDEKVKLETQINETQERLSEIEAITQEQENSLAEKDNLIEEMDTELEKASQTITKLEKMNKSRTEELMQLRDDTSQILEVAEKYYNAELADVPRILVELSADSPSDGGLPKIHRLQMHISNLTSMIINLLNNNDASLHTSSTLSASRFSRDDSIDAIKRIREEAGIQELDVDPKLDIKTLSKAFEQSNDEEYLLAKSAIAVAASVVDKISQINASNEEILALFHSIIPPKFRSTDILADLKEMAKDLSETMDQIRKSLKNTIKTNFKEYSPFKILRAFVIESANMISAIDTTIRPLLGFNGSFRELPSVIHDSLVETQTSLEATSASYEKEMKVMKSEIEDRRVSEERKIRDLEASISKLQADIRSKNFVIAKRDEEIILLKSQIETYKAREVELNATFEAFHRNNEEIERSGQQYKIERDRIQQTLNEKEKAFANRLKFALETEQNRHTDEIKNLKKRMEEREQTQIIEYEKKAKKLALLKKKLADLRDLYEESQMKSREEIFELVRQNQELVASLNDYSKAEKETSQAILNNSRSIRSTPIRLNAKIYSSPISFSQV